MLNQRAQYRLLCDNCLGAHTTPDNLQGWHDTVEAAIEAATRGGLTAIGSPCVVRGEFRQPLLCGFCAKAAQEGEGGGPCR